MKLSKGKKLISVLLFVTLMISVAVSGCVMGETGNKKVRDLEFTVVGESEIPEELKKLMEEKKQSMFKLTYSNENNLYIVVGYGMQNTGGYSIAVEELYLTENTIVFDTELLGPGKGESGGTEPSYPYVVIKTEYLENPVVFQ